MRGSRDIDLQKYWCPDRHGPHFMHEPLFMQLCNVLASMAVSLPIFGIAQSQNNHPPGIASQVRSVLCTGYGPHVSGEWYGQTSELVATGNGAWVLAFPSVSQMHQASLGHAMLINEWKEWKRHIQKETTGLNDYADKWTIFNKNQLRNEQIEKGSGRSRSGQSSGWGAVSAINKYEIKRRHSRTCFILLFKPVTNQKGPMHISPVNRRPIDIQIYWLEERSRSIPRQCNEMTYGTTHQNSREAAAASTLRSSFVEAPKLSQNWTMADHRFVHWCGFFEIISLSLTDILRERCLFLLFFVWAPIPWFKTRSYG
jgi:hypothetical protein